jgi:hypothetical protein
MKEYTKIPIRPEEHERLVKLTYALVGKIDSYLNKPSYSDVIKHLLDHYEGDKNMNTYYITEEHLGSEATEASARLMVDLLHEHGHDVEYGEPMRRNPEPPFNDAEWQECLDLISKM